MKRLVAAAALAWCTFGCVYDLYGPTIPTGSGAVSSLVPSTLPLVTLIDPNRDAMQLRPAQSVQVVIDSKAALDTFLQSSGAFGPSPEAHGGADRLAAIDFTKVQVVVFAASGVKGTETGRIVGIDEQSGTRSVHTVRWTGSGASGFPGDPRASVHMVAVARSSKPMTFLATKEVTLAPTPVRPSPQVGVPWVPGPTPDQNEHPRWRTIPNPEVTEATIEAEARAKMQDLAVSYLKVEKRPLTWTAEHLSMPGPINWLPESEVWVVTAEGGPTRLDADGQTRVPVSGVSPRLVTLLFSVEDGTPVATSGL